MEELSTYIIKGFLILILLIPVGCENFLSEKPTSFISPSNFYQTPKDAKTAVIGCYNHIGAYNAGSYGWWRGWVPAILVDDFDTRPAASGNNSREIGNYSAFDPSATLISSVYSTFVGGLNTYASAINGISGMQDFEGKQALIADAKFLQAFSYFTLVRLFGPVPLIDKGLSSPEEARKLPRASVDTVYNLIIRDLKAGVQYLPKKAPAPGRATKWAAMGLLSKVYLTRKKWSEAAQLAEQIIQDGPYELLDNYAQIFKENNENNKEAIFEIQMEVGTERANQVGQWPRGVGPKGKSDYFLGPNWGGLYIATKDLLDAFEPGDKRRALIDTMVTRSDGTQIKFNADGETPWYNIKRVPLAYIEGKEANNNSGQDFIYLRLGEIYLIAAEAKNEASGPGGAYQYINKIRGRAGISPLSGLTKKRFRAAVHKERRTELFDERKRLFDLYRWGNLIKRVTEARSDAHPKPYQTRWPIPTSAMNINPLLTQNPGY